MSSGSLDDSGRQESESFLISELLLLVETLVHCEP